MSQAYETYDEVRERLEQIVEEVNREDISLDEALKLYEEAVKLGLSACDLSEQDVLAMYPPEESEESEHVAETEEIAETMEVEESEQVAQVTETTEATETAEATASDEIRTIDETRFEGHSEV